jgi:hypothetical protein
MRLKQKETHRKEEQLYFPQPCNVDLFVARKSGVPGQLPAPGLSEISILMEMRWTLEIGASSRMPDQVVDLCSDDLRPVEPNRLRASISSNINGHSYKTVL